MFLMAWKGVRVAICHDNYQYAKANNTSMKDYSENKK